MVAILVALVTLNNTVSRRALEPVERVRILYQPTFMTQIRDGNVKSVTSADGSGRVS